MIIISFFSLTLKILAVTAVSKLTTWIKLFNNFLPRHDHAVLITKWEVIDDDTDILGLTSFHQEEILPLKEWLTLEKSVKQENPVVL